MTNTRTPTTPKLRVQWESRNSSPRVVLARQLRGRTLERTVGPRGRLTFEEAAAVLERPVREVRRSIRTGFLRACPDGRHVTLAACHQFLVEEREDGEAAVAVMDKVRRGEMALIPWEKVHRELGLD